jgi:DNA-binding transcriptional MerR regulator
MKSSATSWSIGEIAGRFGLGTNVLRYWEHVGLLNPVRNGAGRRRYGEAEVTRIAVIVRSKAAGMTLDQIHALLDGQAADRRAVLTAHVQDLDHRMNEMTRSRQMTLHALDCRAHDIASCPNFAAGVADILNHRTSSARLGP